MALGTKDDPWQLSTAPRSSRYTMFLEGTELVCRVGSTTLTYRVRAIDDLHAWLTTQGDWVDLGAADELKNPAGAPSKPGAERNPTPWAAATASAKATEGDSGCTCPRSSSSWSVPNSRKMRETTACECGNPAEKL